MADGTSAFLGSKRWVIVRDDGGTIDAINLATDNAVTYEQSFPYKCKLNRVAACVTTAISSTTAIQVEVYKNTSTLLGTWTVSAANEAVAAGDMVIANVGVRDADGTTNSDGSITYFGVTPIELDAGDRLHFKVVEPASSAGVADLWVEVYELGVHGTATTGVDSVGSWA